MKRPFITIVEEEPEKKVISKDVVIPETPQGLDESPTLDLSISNMDLRISISSDLLFRPENDCSSLEFDRSLDAPDDIEDIDYYPIEVNPEALMLTEDPPSGLFLI